MGIVTMMWTLAVMIIPALVAIYAQSKLTSAMGRYGNQPSRSGLTGKEAAAYVLKKAGIKDVRITSTNTHMADHYDPRNKCLVLSKDHYNGTSIAALGVAAHEAGHAIQHKVGYSMLEARMALVPITGLASKFLPIVIIGGLWFHIFGMIYLGIAVYLILTIFQLITLPVEFDASRRAKEELSDLGIINSAEGEGVAEVLDAAAWTYVAAFISSLLWLLYFISRAQSRH